MSAVKTLAGVGTGFISLSAPMPSSNGMDEALKLVVATIMTIFSQWALDKLKERKARKSRLKAKADEGK